MQREPAYLVRPVGGVAQPGQRLHPRGAHPGRRAQSRAVGRRLGRLRQRPTEASAPVVGVDRTEELGAVEVLEEVERQRGVPDQTAVVVGEPEAGIRTLALAIAAVEQERLGRVVAQGHAVEGGVVDGRQVGGRGQVEVGDVDPLDPDAHSATRWR